MSDTPHAGGRYRPGYEVAAEQVLELIVQLRLNPGDRLPTENDLARQLGTSRTVVREAVKILSALGRVRAQKGRGLYVADDEGMLGTGRWASFFLPTDLDHVYLLFEFRRVQEMETSRLAARHATPAELGAIEKAADVCRHGFDTGREDLFNEGDDAFHTQTPVEAFDVVRRQFAEFDPAQLGAWVERFYALWARSQWKRERFAPSFHLDDESLDPKTWCRFPILSGGFERELAELRKILQLGAERGG
jgi:hypothetical protein